MTKTMHDLATIQRMNAEAAAEPTSEQVRINKICIELELVVDEWEHAEIWDVGDFLLYWAERIAKV